MAQRSPIEWTDATWNPVSGCSRKSPGCDNCYAVPQTYRLECMGQTAKYGGLTVLNGKGDRQFNGIVRCHEDGLSAPLKRKKPTVWFVNSMSDLFHPAVPFEFIDKVFAVMGLTPQHTYQILTKRPERMAEYLNADERTRYRAIARAAIPYAKIGGPAPPKLPLPNVWLGTSVENQAVADERREPLRILAERGWITWVSNEPAISPVDWAGWEFLRWLVSGGESGANARPSHPDWHRAARDFCTENGIAYHFKQWGAWKPVYDRDVEDPDWRRCREVFDATPRGLWCNITGGQGFHGDRVCRVDRVGKKKAGRLLDGRTWDELPTVAGSGVRA